MTMTNGTNGSQAVRVELGGEVVMTTVEDWQTAADQLVAKYGGVPKVEQLNAPGTVHNQPKQVTFTAPTPPPDVKGGQHDVIGEARSTVDFEAAKEAGFAPKQSVYKRGTRVIEWGVDNARESRCDYDAKPTVGEYCGEFVTKIAAEERRDVTANLAKMRMNKAGDIIGPEGRCAMTSQAFGRFMTRMGPGGGQYLQACWPELRAINVNNWAVQIQTNEKAEREAAIKANIDADSKHQVEIPEPRTVVLRTRRNERIAIPEIYAAVSERYATFDVDKVAKALALASPRDARGTVTYNGTRARFEVLFHSDVKPEHYVAGEFFKSGVIVDTSDTGDDGISVSATIWQNLCLNLIIIDEARKRVATIRHIGNVEKLAARFREAFQAALGSLGHFTKAWGYAVEENVLARIASTTEDYVPMKVSEALPGIFNAILERELVPVRGRKEDAIPKLLEMYAKDDSAATRHQGRDVLTRAAVVNAFTRYAHEVEQPDPFVEDDIQRAAGALLYGRNGGKPAPLPYLPIG